MGNASSPHTRTQRECRSPSSRPRRCPHSRRLERPVVRQRLSCSRRPPPPPQPPSFATAFLGTLRRRGTSTRQIFWRARPRNRCTAIARQSSHMGESECSRLLASLCRRTSTHSSAQIPNLPPALWFIMTLGIGICETLRIQKGWANPYESMDNVQALKPDYYPGDLGFDPLGLKPTDPVEFKRMQERELSHGRLAMLAAAGFMAQEAVTGKTWGAQDISFEKFILGGYFTQEATEIARDSLTLP